MEFLFVFLVAYCLGGLFQWQRIPAGQLLGALIGTALVNIFLLEVSYTEEIRFVSRVLAGIMIGMRINQEDVHHLKTMYRPLLFLTGGMLVYTTVLAYFLHTFAGIDMTTALYACVPGGISDISLIAEEYGANLPQVAMVQTIRLLAIMLLYPHFVTFLTKAEGGDRKSKPRVNPFHFPKIPEERVLEAVRTFVYAGFGGGICSYFNVPAGELIGGMVVTLILKLRFQRGYFYPPISRVVQVVAGIIIGSSVTAQTLIELWNILDVTLVSVVFVLAFGGVMGYLVHHRYGEDKVTSILAVAPGGVQEMILLADSLGGKISFVTTLQVFRVVVVLAVFPYWIQMILYFLP